VLKQRAELEQEPALEQQAEEAQAREVGLERRVEAAQERSGFVPAAARGKAGRAFQGLS
jgi:hypothetical protein